MNSPQPIDSSDPRITAYVLGELPAVESLAIEAWLARHPEARAEVEGIREMTAMLQGGFAAELDAAFSAPVRALPSLTVVPPAATPKVIDFQPHFSHRLLTARNAVAAAAAVLVATAFVVWKSPLGGGENQTLVQAEASLIDASIAGATPMAVPYAGAVPGMSHADGVDGLHFTSAGFLAGEEAEDFQSRSLGSDPTITEVRFLSDDPLELQNVPLPAEWLTYLPAPRGVAVPAGQGNGTNRTTYLDADRYPNPEIIQGHLEKAGEINGRRAHSLFFPESQSGPNENTAVKVTGTTRMEAAPDAEKANRLKEAGRKLLGSGDYESAAIVFDKALEALPEGDSVAQLRQQIEALIEAADQLTGSTR